MSELLSTVLTGEVNALRRELAQVRADWRADNARLVDARQEQVNRAVAAEARVRDILQTIHNASNNDAFDGYCPFCDEHHDHTDNCIVTQALQA